MLTIEPFRFSLPHYCNLQGHDDEGLREEHVIDCHPVPPSESLAPVAGGHPAKLLTRRDLGSLSFNSPPNDEILLQLHGRYLDCRSKYIISSHKSACTVVLGLDLTGVID